MTSNGLSHRDWHPPRPVTPTRTVDAPATEPQPERQTNGNRADQDDEDIPENMYRPEIHDPEGWIHRDKLAKIENEELQAAGINLANARSRSQSKIKSARSTSSSEPDSRRGEKRQRLQSPADVEDDVDRASWDFRLPEEIDADDATGTSHIYTNPVLRKSGSKIPVLTSSPMPIPAERYERDTPIARKRSASGTMSFEGDLSIGKIRNNAFGKDDDDTTSSAIASSKPSSPQKMRSQSATISPSISTGPKKTVASNRKVSAPLRTSPSPNRRPGTRSGDQDRPRTAVNRPEGDPPWLATMYKPDPRLPPDQQLIPTLAKKQMQAQWAADGAIPKAYDRDFRPISVHDEATVAHEARRNRTPSPMKDGQVLDEKLAEPQAINLKPVSSIRSNYGRPGTSDSITGGYSTMPKVTCPPIRDSSPRTATSPFPPPPERSTTAPPPVRMQAQNLAEEDEKSIKGCGCCVVM